MSKDLFHTLREKELHREREREPLNTHLRICYIRNFNQYFEQKK